MLAPVISSLYEIYCTGCVTYQTTSIDSVYNRLKGRDAITFVLYFSASATIFALNREISLVEISDWKLESLKLEFLFSSGFCAIA